MAPFTAEELEPTRRPLLEASLLPPRAYFDEGVAAWEAEHVFLGGWVCAGHAGPVSQRGSYVTRLAGAGEVRGGGECIRRGAYENRVICGHKSIPFIETFFVR